MSEYIEKKDGIHYIKYKPLMDTDSITSLVNELTELVNSSPEKIRILSDFSHVESAMTHAHRRQYAEGIRPLEHNIYKSAVIGLNNPIIRAAATVLISFSGRRNIEIFTSKQDALTWLRE